MLGARGVVVVAFHEGELAQAVSDGVTLGNLPALNTWSRTAVALKQPPNSGWLLQGAQATVARNPTLVVERTRAHFELDADAEARAILHGYPAAPSLVEIGGSPIDPRAAADFRRRYLESLQAEAAIRIRLTLEPK